MSQELIHVYLMPGMAASPEIFEYINLPKEQFRMHYLEWILPLENESLPAYAKRMNTFVKHKNVVLLGVSFGGVLVQEMSKYLKVRKLIIVSSIKSMSELPRHMMILKTTKAYKLLPTQWASNIELFAKYAIGENVQKRLDLYKKYLSVNDPRYLNWAIREMVCWDQKSEIPHIVHIHGDNDAVFPIKYIKDCILIKGGTHVMILNKYRWFNANLPRIILEDSE
ncbi:alpha/beta fold hydrolase [Aestuariivivens sediminicola]|uniref:alpha/beta fold hydrolase n=1 Tax=Aestuariivivens sediminicola TaxID=2913560 RepID=UPI001F5826EA|nr:alpha/beta hydrolase [Aestuariivivens sediminicola]